MILPKLERSLAGLQAGMFGGIAILAVMNLVSILDRRSWWTYPNLLAAHFYGVRAVVAGVGWATVSGIAFQLLIASCAGAVFGAICGGMTGSRRITLLGLGWGVGVFFITEQYFRFTTPVVLAYLPRSACIVAHMIYGVCLAAMGRIAGDTPDAPEIEKPVADVSELGVREIPHEGASIVQSTREDAGSAGHERTL